ncbi:MAG TPA: hypothetical protein P5305_03955 [Rubrivivax sp.]|nr:hypothetical protein [Rubrivivax sp.]HRY87016.1 hypothetical protein [Rubrivivax sp.]
MLILLQRQLSGDSARWRTVGRLALDKVDQVLHESDALARLFSDISAMRLAADASANHAVVATWSWHEGWQMADTARSLP